ncbi:MAG: hypothetical protein CVU63_02430 [Deltaproteobacteria bacterium HGW-Deltaproteobacteria-20]|nr:MAG: hypothetical protein CVU63_02430 [Deltaproteobacteria bacterium HGW-Deltaproteobacteria-20]
MKYVVLLVALWTVVPFLAMKAASSERVRKVLMGVAVFDMFNPTDLNLISEESYRGDSRGIEITSVDILLLALFFSQRLRGQALFEGRRLWLARGVYLAAVLLSFVGSPDVLKSTYSVWKLLRMYFAFDVLCTAFVELGLVSAATWGLGAAVVSQGLLALQQKYVYGMVRVVGSQSHPNSLAMIVNMVSPIAFALLLSGKGRWQITVPVVMLAALCNVFSLSRGGMMMFITAMGLVFVLSMLQGVTRRKLAVLGLALAAVAAVLAKAADTIINRFLYAPKESEEARHLFNEAARMMADDHTFGVGINMYSMVLDKGGYADRLGIYEGDRNGIAHHIYWLTAAELGYAGLVAYVLMLAGVWIAAARAARIRGVRGEIAIGVLSGLAVTYLQGTAEWILRQTNFAYVFWTCAALAASAPTRPSRVSPGSAS